MAVIGRELTALIDWGLQSARVGCLVAEAEAVAASGGELEVNATGAHVSLLPAERQLVEASVVEARIKGHRSSLSGVARAARVDVLLDIGPLICQKSMGSLLGCKRTQTLVQKVALHLQLGIKEADSADQQNKIPRPVRARVRVRVCECVRACVRACGAPASAATAAAAPVRTMHKAAAVVQRGSRGSPPQWRTRAGGAAQARAGALRSACFSNALGDQAVLAGLSWLLFSERASSSTPIVPPVFFLSEQTLCE
jgi:hypothetical protein